MPIDEIHRTFQKVIIHAKTHTALRGDVCGSRDDIEAHAVEKPLRGKRRMGTVESYHEHGFFLP